MATFVGTGNRVYVAHLDLSGKTKQVNFGDLTREMVDFTTFNDGGFTVVSPGLIKGSGSVMGFQDYAANALDDQISVSALGSQYPVSVVPSASGTITAGDPCWISRGLLAKESPLTGAKGEAGGFEWGFEYDTAIVQSKVLHPSTARTTTSTGTAVAMAGPTAAQTLYAGLHVTAFSGLTNIVVKVQSDDNSGFTSATDRITFTTATGTTSEWKTVAGDFSTETHLRASWTVTGTGSATFVVTAGVI